MASRYGSMSDSGRKQRQYNRSGRHAIKHNEKSPLLCNHAKTDVEDLPGSSHGSMEVLMPQGRFSSYRQLSNDLRRLRSNNNNRPKSTQTLTIITHFNDDDDEDDDYAKYSTDSHGILNRSGGGGVGDGASGNVKLAPFTKRQLLTVIMLSFANFCSTVVFSCIAPFFPDEARSKGLNPTQIGIIFGILELVMFISAPILGKYLHIIGSKFMFTTGLFATGITSILFGLLNLTDSGPMFFWLSFIVRCFEAVADAAFLTASFAICARTFPGRIATVVGILETFTGLGFTVGPAIGGLLYELGGYQVPFSVLGSLLLIAALLSYFLLDPSIEDDNMDDSKGVLALLKIPMIVLMMAAVMTCAMTLTFVDPTLAAHLNSFNLSTVVVGLMFLWGAGVYTITAPFWGYFIDRFKHTPLFLMLIGALLSFVAMIFIGPTPIFGFNKSLYSIAASLVVMGLGVGAVYIPTFQTCLNTAQAHGYPDNYETYGCVSGLFQAVFSLGGFIGPTVGGIAVELIGFEWSATVVAAAHLLVAVALIAYILLMRRREKEKMHLIVPAGDSELSNKWQEGACATFSL